MQPISRLVELLAQKSEVDGVTVYRADAPTDRIPTVYHPSVCVIAQGAKRVFLNREVYWYRPGQYLAVAVEMPLSGQVMEASSERPYLCAQVDLRVDELEGMVAAESEPQVGRGLFVGQVEAEVVESLTRLLELGGRQADMPMLAPMRRREFYYWLVRGPYGQRIAEVARGGTRMQRIAKVMDAMKQNLVEWRPVEELARMAGMSVSTFHEHFRSVAAMSPLQYQKRLRLLEARRRLLSGEGSVTEAAYAVGYESASQFSREYSRMFGVSPKRDSMTSRVIVT